MRLCKVLLPVRLLTVSGSTIRVGAILFQGSFQQTISYALEARVCGVRVPPPRPLLTGCRQMVKPRNSKKLILTMPV
jgi:hypothetical protein